MARHRNSLEAAGALVGRSPAHQRLLAQIEKIAPIGVEVLITGPSGVGKELYARHLHECSPRACAAFVAVNCGAIPTELFENEFFGHVAGAYTGAHTASEGLVVRAEGGTLFLDEVDALAALDQVKLLRFLQEKEYRRLGESHTRRADVRIVAATNADLARAVQDGRFRQDLFFRLRVVPLDVPPLAQRPDDIRPLLDSLVQRYTREYALPPIAFTDAALRRIERYPWPGNVRELENCVRCLICMQPSRPLEPEELPLLTQPFGVGADDDDRDIETVPHPDDTAELLDQPFQAAKRIHVDRFERSYLTHALRQNHGNITRAAEASGKDRRAFFELMRKHDIDADEYRA
ncbi:sigma 54-interacting transcriptional regulator [Haliangium sp.]|uniref:sigma 54-interacting transcriptional regulator n=1 Tax=Haliangium sp. TaxID=2663208 RepID=UPI003D0DCB15